MKKIICSLIVLLSLASIAQGQIITYNQKQSNKTNFNENDFEAEIGIGDEERPRIFLDGGYRSRWRYVAVSGTATNGDQQVRFQGFFSGNFFLLQIPLRGRIINIFGRCSFDEDREFSGRWRARGIRISGWIEGSFT